MGRPAAKAQKRKQTKVKDPNRPKRPTSAYFYFIASKREEMKKAGKKVTKVAEWTKQISQVWRDLTAEGRECFDVKAAADKKRYTAEMSAYKGKDENKPKRPQSSYFLFLADFRTRNKGVYDEHKDLLRGAGEAWKELDDDEKKPYEIAAGEEKKKYEVKMAEYNASSGGAAANAAAKKAKMAPAKNGKGKVADDDDDDDEDDEDDESEEESSEEESD